MKAIMFRFGGDCWYLQMKFSVIEDLVVLTLLLSWLRVRIFAVEPMMSAERFRGDIAVLPSEAISESPRQKRKGKDEMA
jgi:hypothetical protein